MMFDAKLAFALLCLSVSAAFGQTTTSPPAPPPSDAPNEDTTSFYPSSLAPRRNTLPVEDSANETTTAGASGAATFCPTPFNGTDVFSCPEILCSENDQCVRGNITGHCCPTVCRGQNCHYPEPVSPKQLFASVRIDSISASDKGVTDKEGVTIASGSDYYLSHERANISDDKSSQAVTVLMQFYPDSGVLVPVTKPVEAATTTSVTTVKSEPAVVATTAMATTAVPLTTTALPTTTTTPPPTTTVRTTTLPTTTTTVPTTTTSPPPTTTTTTPPPTTTTLPPTTPIPITTTEPPTTTLPPTTPIPITTTTERPTTKTIPPPPPFTTVLTSRRMPQLTNTPTILRPLVPIVPPTSLPASVLITRPPPMPLMPVPTPILASAPITRPAPSPARIPVTRPAPISTPIQAPVPITRPIPIPVTRPAPIPVTRPIPAPIPTTPCPNPRFWWGFYGQCWNNLCRVNVDCRYGDVVGFCCLTRCGGRNCFYYS